MSNEFRPTFTIVPFEGRSWTMTSRAKPGDVLGGGLQNTVVVGVYTDPPENEQGVGLCDHRLLITCQPCELQNQCPFPATARAPKRKSLPKDVVLQHIEPTIAIGRLLQKR